MKLPKDKIWLRKYKSGTSQRIWYKIHYNNKTTKVERTHDYKSHLFAGFSLTCLCWFTIYLVTKGYCRTSASLACAGLLFIWWHKVAAEHQPHLLVLGHNLSSDTRLLQNISLTCVCWVAIYLVTQGYCRTSASLACVGSQFIQWHKVIAEHQPHLLVLGHNLSGDTRLLQNISLTCVCWVAIYLVTQRLLQEHQPHLLVLGHNLSSDTRLLQNISLTCLCWVTIYPVTQGYCRTSASLACVGSQFIQWHKVIAEHQPHLLVLGHNLSGDTRLLQNISLTCLCWVTIYPVKQGCCRTSASLACVGSQFIQWHKVTADHQPHLLVLGRNLSGDTRLLQNISFTCLCWATIYPVTQGCCRISSSLAWVGSQFIWWHKVTAEHQPHFLCWVTIYPATQGYCRTLALLACVGSQFIWWHKVTAEHQPQLLVLGHNLSGDTRPQIWCLCEHNLVLEDSDASTCWFQYQNLQVLTDALWWENPSRFLELTANLRACDSARFLISL